MLYRCITNNLKKIVEREEEIALKWKLTKLVEGGYKDRNILRIHDNLYPHKS
jgi:hypothetical protein